MIQDHGEARDLVKFSDAISRRISRELSRQTVKGGCRCTSPTGIRRPGGHEAQGQEAEKEGRIKEGSEKKGQRTKRDAGATRVCGENL